jgi:hypothetical protein
MKNFVIKKKLMVLVDYHNGDHQPPFDDKEGAQKI